MTSWIRRYSAARAERLRPEITPFRREEQQNRTAPATDGGAFGQLQLAPQTANEHLDAIDSATRSMEPFRARQFTRTIEGFYKSLGKTLSKIAEPERSELAEASILAMRRLVEETGANERLMPAIATLSSLLDKRGRATPAEMIENTPKALDAVLAFTAAQEGRAGGHTALHLYRNLIEVLERRTKDLTAAGRPEIWREVGAFIDRASPAARMDQAHAADLNVWVLDALGRGATWRAALEEAEAKALERAAPAQAAALEQIAQTAQGVAEGTPARTATDELSGALAELVRSNPAGDDALYRGAQNLMAALVGIQGAIGEHNLPILRDVAAIALELARSPAAATILEHLAAHLPSLIGCPADVLAAARGEGAARAALALLDASTAIAGRDPGELAEARAAFDVLSAPLAARAALALLPHLASPETAVPLARALTERVKHAADQEELERFAQKFAACHPPLRAQLGEDAGPIAAELAKGFGPAIPAGELERIAQLALAVKAALPAVDVAQLIPQDGAGRPGLSDLRGELRHDPVPLLAALLAPVSELQQDGRDQLELVRRAVHLAREAAMIDRPIEAAFGRVEEDWRFGLTEPNALTFVGSAGSQLAVRAAQGREGIHFLRAHDKLPPELAFTAGRHLDQAQLGWLLSKVESFRSHAQVRILRDLVFAAIEAGRLDLLDAFVAGKVDQKTLMANAEFVAVELRQGRLQELPIDHIVEKLANGEDAAAAIEAERQGGNVDLDQQDLARFKAELDALIAATPPENQVYADKGAVWREPLMAVIDAIGAGRWPWWKAENDVGKRQLEGLTAEQIAIWMQDEVTGKPDPAQAQRPEVQRAFTLLRGLAVALPEEVSLAGGGFEDVTWDQASLDRLQKKHAELVGALRAAERGSDEHRRLSRELAPVIRRVAAVELKLALDRMFANPPDPVTALLETKGVLAAAQAAVRGLGGRGSAEVIQEIRQTARTIQISPRDGLHAVDENTLEAFFSSFNGGSCLRAGGGSNQVSLIEHIASAMYKIGRVINGGNTEVRGFARLYRFTFPGYTHKHGIQLDILRTPSGGQNISEESKRIIHQHMLAKAEAMGLPYLTNDDTALKLAEEKGLRVLQSQQVTFHVDHGFTGLHHAQNIDFGTYWILWQHALSYGNLAQEPNESLEAARPYTKHVILPRGVELEGEA